MCQASAGENQRRGRCWRAYLGDVREADQVGHDAHSSNEELTAIAEEPGVLIHQGSDEALHGTELVGKRMGSATCCSQPLPTHLAAKPGLVGEDRRPIARQQG